MTVEVAIALLDELDDGREEDHSSADKILLRFLDANGFHAIVEAYERVKKRNGGAFWYA